MPLPPPRLPDTPGFDVDYTLGQAIQIMLVHKQTSSAISAARLGLVMKFEAESLDQEFVRTTIASGGRPCGRTIPGGWQCTIYYARLTGNMTQVALATINEYLVGNGRNAKFDIFVSVRDSNGVAENYIFEDAVLTKHNFGVYEANREVNQYLRFWAANCTSQ